MDTEKLINDQVAVEFQTFEMTRDQEDLISGRVPVQTTEPSHQFWNLEFWKLYFKVQDVDVYYF